MVEGEMRVRLELPTGLRQFAGGKDSFEVRAATLAEAIRGMNAEYPGLAYRLLDDQGRMRRFVLVFVNEDPVAHLPPEDVRLRDGDTVYIVPSVAGG
jgi:molybdopterin converting factor small subunit